MTIERLAELPLVLYDAEYGWDDPMRRQLAERAQLAGVTLRPVVEVEDLEAAVQLTARGIGDTVVARAVLGTMRGAAVAAGDTVRRAAVGDVRVHRPARRSGLSRDPRVRRARRAAARAARRADPVPGRPGRAGGAARPPRRANVTSC